MTDPDLFSLQMSDVDPGDLSVDDDSPAMDPEDVADRTYAATNMRVLARLHERRARIVHPFQVESARLAVRLAEATAQIDKAIAYREGLIESWHRAALAARVEKPTVVLPHGRSLLRKAAPTIEITNPDELLLWARDAGVDLLPDPKPMEPAKSKVNKVVWHNADSAEPGSILPAFPSGTNTKALVERDGGWYDTETGEAVLPIPGVRVIVNHPTPTITPGVGS